MGKLIYLGLTQLTVIVHFLFILFVVTGGFFIRGRRWLLFTHLGSVVWAIYAELANGVVCPLTSLENYFGYHAGLTSYEDGFITRYLVPVIYQENLTPNLQYILVAVVVVINLAAYWYVLRWKRVN